MRRFLHPSLTLLVALLNSSILLSVFVNANDENDRPTPAPVIPNQYIVYYKKNTDRVATNKRLFYSPTSSIASSNAFSVVHQMKKAVAVKGINEEQYQQLLQDPSVDRIIPDFEISIDAVQSNPYAWGLDRIDQSNLPLDKSYQYNYDGTGVQVYIFDTGIRKTHTEFGGRAKCGLNLITNEDCTDNNFHGTHVAGTVGGMLYGVAKKVTLIDVKVLNSSGSGYFSSVLAGLEYVVDQKKKNPLIPMVINMSLGGNFVLNDVEEAINEAVAAKIVVVVAAGNSAVDACETTPGFATNAITVGASDINDARAYFSNFGDCVDLYAPGVDVVSASNQDDIKISFASGTSMAAPHVAGAAALYLQANPEWTPAQVWQAMRDDASEAIQRTYNPLQNYFRMRRTTERILQVQQV